MAKKELCPHAESLMEQGRNIIDAFSAAIPDMDPGEAQSRLMRNPELKAIDARHRACKRFGTTLCYLYPAQECGLPTMFRN